jgi:hypothetical protein
MRKNASLCGYKFLKKEHPHVFNVALPEEDPTQNVTGYGSGKIMNLCQIG